MGNSIKSKLYEDVTALMDDVDSLRIQGNAVPLFDRATEIGNVAILYFDLLDAQELELVASVINLARIQIDGLKLGSVSTNTGDLAKIVDDIEDLYISKGFLFDKTKEKNMSIALILKLVLGSFLDKNFYYL